MRKKQLVIAGIIFVISVMTYGQTSFEEIRKAAEQGNADAQNKLGVMYKKGQGVQADFKIAASWFRKAAMQGNAAAETNLGLLYESGEGVGTDLKQALSWFQMAAEQGNTDAKNGIVAVTLLLNAEAEDRKNREIAPAPVRAEIELNDFSLDTSLRQVSGAVATKGLPNVICSDVEGGFKDCTTQRGQKTDGNYLGLQFNFFHGLLYRVSCVLSHEGLTDLLHALTNRYGEPELSPTGAKRWKFGPPDRQIILMRKADEDNMWMAMLVDIKQAAKRESAH